MESGNDAVVVLVTAASAEEAEQIAEELVSERLAACVNLVGPIRSIYRWQGAVEREPEWLLIIKTVQARLEELETRLRAIHSYENPEIVALPIASGAAAYLAWLGEQVSR